MSETRYPGKYNLPVEGRVVQYGSARDYRIAKEVMGILMETPEVYVSTRDLAEETSGNESPSTIARILEKGAATTIRLYYGEVVVVNPYRDLPNGAPRPADGFLRHIIREGKPWEAFVDLLR